MSLEIFNRSILFSQLWIQFEMTGPGLYIDANGKGTVLCRIVMDSEVVEGSISLDKTWNGGSRSLWSLSRTLGHLYEQAAPQ